MVKRERELGHCRGEGEEPENCRDDHALRYIGILIGKMRGQRMHVPLAPYTPGRDPPIQRHESKYMPIHPSPAGR